MPSCASLAFDAGTIIAEFPDGNEPPESAALLLARDERIAKWRCPGYSYAPLVRALVAEKIPFKDNVRNYNTLSLKLNGAFAPRPHQKLALEKWRGAVPPGRGVAVMPTGSGKSYLAMLAMTAAQRSSIIIVPTIDLVQQWAGQIERFFGIKAGMLGGGSHDIQDITVSTYDSAVMFMEHIGNRFGMVIFDECHHLPGTVNRQAAMMCIAPYRLGLTATPERSDGGEELLYNICGPKICEINIDELEGQVLALYETHKINVNMLPDEAKKYAEARKIYTDFIRSCGIDFRQKDGWSKFIIMCARRPDGRKAMNAYYEQKAIAAGSASKMNLLRDILARHCGERAIIFTADNDTAYSIGNLFCLPVITHKTKSAERKDFLDRFRSGEYAAIVTSKVLNEGVDVPEASVGIVISGSGSVREHVQRLGRILRAAKGKQAQLYELVSDGTGEVYVSNRRREHRAYGGGNNAY